MITKNNTVAVLMGGVSREADISRKTGTAILQALLSLGYHAVKVEYNPSCVLKQLKAVGAEVVFIALHGKYGEDGTIQSILELRKIPYTGSGVSSSAITMDKIISSRVFKDAGVRMAFSKPYYLKNGIDTVAESIEKNFKFPVVYEKEKLKEALKRVFAIESRILAEAYLDGKEFTIAVLNGKALPIIQICPHSGQYDFHSKYTSGATDYIVPAPLPGAAADEMTRMAILGYEAAECSGVVRFDFRTDKRGTPFLLEANSIPGMTETSLVPKAAAAIGMDFPSLCENILLKAGVGKV